MARERTLKAVYTFHTTTEAMKMEQCAREHGIPGRLIPVPRQISAGCGMAWAAPALIVKYGLMARKWKRMKSGS